MIVEYGVTRRSFLKLVGGAGAVFALGSFTSLACEQPQPTGTATPKTPATDFVPNAFLRIDPDGTVTVTINKSEMGQGVRTSLAMLAAEELDADWSKVKALNATGDGSTYGNQGTGGSGSTTGEHQHYRQLGAAARAMLVAAAAKNWGVDPSTCTTEKSRVLHTASGRSADYGTLTGVAATMEVPSNPPLKQPSEFKIIGKPTNRVDNFDVATGKAIYTIDVKVDGMVYAILVRPPAFGVSAQSFDDAEARKVAGVVDVVKAGESVAVIAENTWAALKGSRSLKVVWSPNSNSGVSTASLLNDLKAAAVPAPEPPAGSKVVRATYDYPYLAHATMEPMNAVADVRADSATVWAGTQAPDSVQQQVARMLGLPREKVTVNLMLIGGGFGRRSEGDFTSEAVDLSRQLKRPVKVLWTREDDIRHDHYRPMGRHVMQGALDASGNPVAWAHQLLQAGGWGGGKDFRGTGLSYNIPGPVMHHGGVPSPVPNGQWRSVENGIANFAIESFIDELAHAANADPYEFRHRLAHDRAKRVLEAAAQKAGWGEKLPAGHGRGIAVYEGYNGAVAHVIDVAVSGKDIKVVKVVAVVDVGLCVNPKTVEAQIIGGCSDGIAIALSAGIQVRNGGIVEGNFDEYLWPTIDMVPDMDVTIISGGNDPAGMGELGVPSVAPAIANAVFAATGKRPRRLPIRIEDLV